MILRPYFVILISLALTSCNKRTEANVNSETYVPSQTFKEEHTSKNSLDWQGTYQGILPCADCEGIQTKILINSDNTYIKFITYLGKDEKEVQSQGNFSWNASGSEITLESEDKPNTYKVMENALMVLDMEDHMIRGQLEDHYKLNKDLD